MFCNRASASFGGKWPVCLLAKTCPDHVGKPIVHVHLTLGSSNFYERDPHSRDMLSKLHQPAILCVKYLVKFKKNMLSSLAQKSLNPPPFHPPNYAQPLVRTPPWVELSAAPSDITSHCPCAPQKLGLTHHAQRPESPAHVPTINLQGIYVDDGVISVYMMLMILYDIKWLNIFLYMMFND